MWGVLYAIFCLCAQRSKDYLTNNDLLRYYNLVLDQTNSLTRLRIGTRILLTAFVLMPLDTSMLILVRGRTVLVRAKRGESVRGGVFLCKRLCNLDL